MVETWIPTKVSDDYEVSSLGRLRKTKTGRIINGSENRGYVRVSINSSRYYLHRLVADAFFDGNHDGLDVMHRDGNKLNNKVSNLEWCSRSENTKYAFEKDSRFSVIKNVVRCRYCKNYDISSKRCSRFGQYVSSDFYCADGKR